MKKKEQSKLENSTLDENDEYGCSPGKNMHQDKNETSIFLRKNKKGLVFFPFVFFVRTHYCYPY